MHLISPQVLRILKSDRRWWRRSVSKPVTALALTAISVVLSILALKMLQNERREQLPAMKTTIVVANAGQPQPQAAIEFRGPGMVWRLNPATQVAVAPPMEKSKMPEAMARAKKEKVEALALGAVAAEIANPLTEEMAPKGDAQYVCLLIGRILLISAF